MKIVQNFFRSPFQFSWSSHIISHIEASHDTEEQNFRTFGSKSEMKR